jgi:signal transduction histidine kinase
VESSLQEGIPGVLIDYNQMKQLLINLLLNSFDAVSGKGSVRVSTAAVNGDVLITVRDDGSGIGTEDLQRIFDPFFTTKTRGTGLGLAFSRKVAKEHGGDIDVRSAPGEGSEFTIRLPVKA